MKMGSHITAGVKLWQMAGKERESDRLAISVSIRAAERLRPKCGVISPTYMQAIFTVVGDHLTSMLVLNV